MDRIEWPLLLAASLLLSCEYPGVPHPLAAAALAEHVAPPASAARGSAPSQPRDSQNTVGSQSKEGQGAVVSQGKVQVTQKDFKLDPDKVTAKAGTVTFVLKNEGNYTHDFRVEGPGVDEKAPKVGSGRSMEWRITLKPGTYRISCPVSNHADRGMVGTLTVVD